jgi:hypothetical protein
MHGPRADEANGMVNRRLTRCQATPYAGGIDSRTLDRSRQIQLVASEDDPLAEFEAE